MIRLRALALCALLPLGAARAAPVLDAPRPLGENTLYPDDERPELFYYAPGPLELAEAAGGRPDLSFLQLRWVGTEAYGNSGESGFQSTLTFRVRMRALGALDLERMRRIARKLAGRPDVELRPLPIRALDAVVNYAPVAGSDERRSIEGGFFEAEESPQSLSARDSFWSERVYTLPMDPQTSQLLWTLLRDGQAPVSLGYAFIAKGVGAPAAEIRISESGGGTSASEIAEQLGLSSAGEPPERERVERAVVSGAIPLRVDARRWPDLFQRIDFNEQVPPGYAALRVYCYDFKDGLAPDLAFKRVDFEAEAVGGRAIPLTAKFLASQPELYARSIRFPVAIRMDRPFRYRVVSARRDGAKETGPWQERADWSRIVDVTSRSDSPPVETRP